MSILKPEDEANWLKPADFREFAFPYEVHHAKVIEGT
jgi:hypothetical protein